MSWSDPVSTKIARARANGRAAFNKQRQREATKRRREVAELFGTMAQVDIAKKLGVSKSTISQDVKWIRAEVLKPKKGREYSVRKLTTERSLSDFTDEELLEIADGANV